VKIKRIKHQVQNLGQMFCGWELMFDYRRLAELGSGQIVINVLTAECLHNGESIPKLGIANTLTQWLDQDLESNGIPKGSIQVAELIVDFKTERYKGQRLDSSWADPTPYFIGCKLDCRSRIQAFDREFVSSYSDTEEWPESYSWCKG
jgi:hypothetical protein